MKIKDKIVFVYMNPHYLHSDWAKSVNAKFICYSGERETNLIKGQIKALKTELPTADVYIAENIRCMLPIIRKILSRRSRVLVFCINSDTLFYDYPKYNWVTKKIMDFYIEFVDCFISSSEYVKTLALKYTNIPHIVVYPYVDYKKWCKIKVNLDSPDIAYIGNICRFRGQDLLLEAMKGEKMNIKLIGREAEELNYIPSNVSVTKVRVENPEDYLKSVGNYINSSRHDSFGINVLESMAAGIPPIVSTNVGAKEILPDKCLISD